MTYTESDEQIYDLHTSYHDGAFVDCRQCRAIISLVDRVAESARQSAMAEMKAAYSSEPRRGRPPKETPAPIDAPPEEIAWAVVNTPPKRRWRYMGQDSSNPQPTG